MIRDMALFAHSVLHAGWSNSFGYYWDSASKLELHNLVNRLSNVEDKERHLIRHIIQEENLISVLDVACGPATEKSGYDINGLNVDYTGLDASKYMIKTAKHRHPDAKLLRARSQELPFGENSFDAVLLKHILEHLPNCEDTIYESLRVARDIVIIDFFHTLIPFGKDIHLKDKRGFYNNWYSRQRFHSILDSCPISGYAIHQTSGSVGQTADVYVIHKR
jgi:ubiquinone/menaquinone biosynthesis C-methylase UbiE